jgi:DNA-binding NarL/FixJ family response regulator
MPTAPAAGLQRSVIVADDDVLLREGIARLLGDAGYNVIARAGIGVLLLSAHVEVDTAIDFLRSGDRIGYLLKTRITKVEDLVDALERIAAGGAVIDPVLVQELLGKQHRVDPLGVLTNRERDVLALVAEGRSNSGIAHELWISEGAVEKHVRSILAKLQLPATDDVHRRVLAVLTFLDVQ